MVLLVVKYISDTSVFNDSKDMSVSLGVKIERVIYKNAFEIK